MPRIWAPDGLGSLGMAAHEYREVTTTSGTAKGLQEALISTVPKAAKQVHSGMRIGHYLAILNAPGPAHSPCP